MVKREKILEYAALLQSVTAFSLLSLSWDDSDKDSESYMQSTVDTAESLQAKLYVTAQAYGLQTLDLSKGPICTNAFQMSLNDEGNFQISILDLTGTFHYVKEWESAFWSSPTEETLQKYECAQLLKIKIKEDSL